MRKRITLKIRRSLGKYIIPFLNSELDQHSQSDLTQPHMVYPDNDELPFVPDDVWNDITTTIAWITNQAD